MRGAIENPWVCSIGKKGTSIMGGEVCLPAMRNPGDGAKPIIKQPSTRNIRLPRATTRSRIAGRNPSREPRSEYMSGRITTSTISVAMALNGDMKLAYNVH